MLAIERRCGALVLAGQGPLVREAASRATAERDAEQGVPHKTRGSCSMQRSTVWVVAGGALKRVTNSTQGGPWPAALLLRPDVS